MSSADDNTSSMASPGLLARLAANRAVSRWLTPVRRRLPALLEDALEARDNAMVERLAGCLLELEPHSQAALRALSRHAFATGTHQAMLTFFERHHAAHPDSAAICVQALQHAAKSGEVELAIRWAGKALSLGTRDLHPFSELGRYHLRHGDLDALRALLERVPTEGVYNLYPAIKVAFLLLKVGRADKARAVLLSMQSRRPGDFRLAAARVSCCLAANDLPSAVKAGLEMRDREDDTRRALFFYQDILARLEQEGHGGRRFETERALFEQRMNELLRQPPTSRYRAWLEQSKQRMEAIRATVEARRSLRAQTSRVSLICPIHRPADIDNAIQQLGGQKWRHAEAVFAVNGGRVTAEDIRRRWRGDKRLVLVDCQDLDRVGAVLNRAIAESTGDIVVRMDADDVYHPAYTADVVLCFEHFGADVIGQRNMHRFLSRDDQMLFCPSQKAFGRAVPGQQISGGCLSFRRAWFDRRPFNEEVQFGEDTDFVAAAIAGGAHVQFAAPFNFHAVRAEDPADHTWGVSRAELVLIGRQELLGPAASAAWALGYASPDRG